MAPTRTTPAAKKPAPKAPQDRKRPSVQIAAESKPEGHEFLKPVALLRSSEQATLNADLMALFEGMGIDMGAAQDAAAKAEADGTDAAEAAVQEVEVNSDAIRAIGKMSALLEQFVLEDKLAAFEKLDTGKGALNRISDLGMWYLEQLGE